MDELIKEATKIFKNGGIVIFPTDTAYGIGCRIDDEKAIRRLFEIRKRPETKATPVLFDSFKMVEDYVAQIPHEVREKLMEKYWPGALTIVLQSRIQKIPSLVRGGGNTLGVRIPDNGNLRKVIKEVGVPIIGTSANFAGEQTPYAFEDLDPALMKQVDFVLKGDVKLKNASTVIDCSIKPWKILRQGAVKISIK